ncbi:hypothetical protein [Clostridium oryzae]|uniref:DUF2334 domain-containing protein n=1 Tax=Clostridium oryzae TaxID=1450648 RepID=A0A1V4IE82_9CLOT|nr:hypothetical protein [Clostridium oryzae]OPJ58271.1 hypothetical protein CLORY_36910 [Clostridium oryzae]
MMYRKFYRQTSTLTMSVLLTFLFIYLDFINVLAYPNVSHNNVLMLYDVEGDRDNVTKELSNLYALIRTNCSLLRNIEINNYKHEFLKDSDYVVIFINSPQAQQNQELAKDLEKYNGNIIFVGAGAEKYSQLALFKGITIEGTTADIGEIKYKFYGEDKTRSLFIQNESNITKIVRGKQAKYMSYGSFSENGIDYPYAINSGKLWIISFYSIEPNSYLLAKDILARILKKQDIVDDRGVYLQLNDVSPLCDLDKLRLKMKWLDYKGMPYIIQLTPIFTNYDTKQMNRFIKLIVDEQEKGNATTVIGNLVGWNIRDEWSQEISGNAPDSNSERMVPEKLIETSIKVYAANKIYPVAFSASQDVLFDDSMFNVYKHFSTFISNGSSGKCFKQAVEKYLWRGKYINSIDSYKAISEEDKVVLQVTEEKSFNEFKASINKYIKDDYNFLDLRQVNGRIKFDGLSIKAYQGDLLINGLKKDEAITKHAYENKLPDTEKKLSNFNARIKESLTFVISLVAIFIFMFVMAFTLGKRIDRKKHMR